MRPISIRTWLPMVLGTIAALLLPVFAKIFLSLPLWIILGGIVVLVVLTTALTRWYERLKSPPALPLAEAFSPENRRSMLDLVQDKWIRGLLKNERYYDKELLPLELYRCIGDPSALVLENPLEPAMPLPPGTSITEVFVQAGGELLILGEPGSGKSTLLLELTCNLLERAKTNQEDRIPIVLLLSSWAIRQLPLEQWIAEELQTKYQVPSEFGLAWAQAHRFLLLLDGLDEVTPEVLPACIEALNTYARQAQKAMVVCCRTKEYLDQPSRLGLHTAVSVQPLSSQHIDTYLSTRGEHVSGLKSALQQSATLTAFAATPLFLKVLMLAYHGKPAEDVLLLAATAPADQPKHLWHHYVEWVVVEEERPPHATPQQTKHWLAWLARRMMEHHQSEFYLEDFQPDWLRARQRSWYQWSVVLLFGLLSGLFGGLFGGLFFGLLGGLLVGLVFGLLFGLSFGLRTEIEPVEVFTWSWKRLLFGLSFGLSFGLLFGLSFGHLLVGGLFFGLLGGLFGGPLFGLLGGLPGKQLPKHLRHSPNESLRRSTANGLGVGLGVGLGAGLFFGLFFRLLFGLGVGLGVGLLSGLVFGLLSGLLFGLGAAVQHVILRLWLWRAGCTPTPWHYVAFLDDAVEQLLLRKVGGGYIFRHPLLQDYFASLETNGIADSDRGHMSQASPHTSSTAP